ncbi:MAG: YetF domain-containing protein [Gemmatimonadaceae bacterium]
MLNSGMLSQLSTNLFVPGVSIAEKVVRSVLVYGFLIVLLRVAGKRTLGQLTSFDLVVLLLLSNTVQNAIIGNDNSLVGGLLGAVVLIAANYVVVRLLYQHKKLDRVVEGSTTILMHHGKFLDENMKHNLVTQSELESAARKQGIGRMSDVRVARLETEGALTFELESPTEHEKHLSDLITRLERIEAMLTRLEASGNDQEADQ